MDGIKEWAIMLCTVSVGSAFVVFLIPDGNLKKTANVVITLFLLSVVILPIFGNDSFDIDVPEISIDDFPDEYDYLQDFSEFFISHSENVARQQITDILSEICSDKFNIHVNVNADADGNAVLSDIHITILPSDSASVGVIKYEVGRITGIVPKVMIERDNAESD